MRCRHAVSISALALVVCGCGNKATILPEPDTTMLETYRAHAGQLGAADLLDARLALRRPLAEAALDGEVYTRSPGNEIHAQFVRLPNPDLVMHVFAHLATADEVPVPGYSTVFPLYPRVVYALPGEVP